MQTSYSTPQRSIEWFRSRLGLITGSSVGKIMSKGRNAEFSQSALSYIESVAAEKSLADYIRNDDDNLQVYLDEVNITSKAMRIGAQREYEAKDLYGEITGLQVLETGLVTHPDIDGFGSSPDGLVGPDGVLEIKCPTPAVYMGYAVHVNDPESLKRMNADYYWQCLAHMAVTGRDWCDFAVYCPYMARPIHIVRIPRDEDAVSELTARVRLALNRVDALAAAANAGHG